MSLTGPPPPLPPILANPPVGADIPAPVVEIIAARQIGALASSAEEILANATGPGNVVTGIVSELSTSGNVTIVTPQGAELTLHDPPAQILQLGSSATLRILTNTAVPQATLLAVDGKPVAALLARLAATGDVPAETPALTIAPPQVSASPAQAITGTASPLIDSALALVASLAATLDEADTLPGASLRTALPSPRITAGTPEESLGPTVVATLIRATLPRPGGVAPSLGTRYALTVTAIAPSDTTEAKPTAQAAAPDAPSPSAGDETAAPATAPVPPATRAPSPAAPAPASAQVPQEVRPAPAAPSPAPPSSGDFIHQVTVLAGRVLPPGPAGETVIETAFGTLSLPAGTIAPPVGSAVQLRVTAVAPPLPGTEAALAEAAVPAAYEPDHAPPPPSPLAEAIAALALVEPQQAKTIETELSLQPGPQLAAILFGFLAGTAPAVSRRWTDSPARKALDGIDRGDLTARLDTEAAEMGQTVAPQHPGDWAITVLPYLGTASTQPMRVYRKPQNSKKAVGAQRAGDHFVIEVELNRLGQMQFEGLVRDRRFDLLLRSNRVLEPGLQSMIGRVFRDTVGISGYAGDIAFGRVVAFPLVPLGSAGAHRAVSA